MSAAILIHGDARDLTDLDDASVDAVVTDPPYELGFMGKKWDASGIAHDVAMWGEVLRVLKPGGHLLAFGGTRTWHRMVCAVEDAGFEVRDSIAWLYGSGFPKSLDVGKAIDKAAGAERERSDAGATTCPDFPAPCGGHPSANGSLGGGIMRHALPTAPATPEAERWNGWGTALKPAHEPIVVARKPFPGTVAGNVVAHGTGALNIDACRIGMGDEYDPTKVQRQSSASAGMSALGSSGFAADHEQPTYNAAGRWPANVVLDEDMAAVLDEPSRFFYCAKSSKKERNAGLSERNPHPTVKPIALMEWLVKLVTPPGGIVLDPFCGSGSTLVAATRIGFDCIGVDIEAEHVEIAKQRVTHAGAVIL